MRFPYIIQWARNPMTGFLIRKRQREIFFLILKISLALLNDP